MKDFRQDERWGVYLAKRGWSFDWLKPADGKEKILVLVVRLGWWPWTMMKIQRSNSDPDFADLQRLKKKYRTVETIVEPLLLQNERSYREAGFHLTKQPYLAMKTVVNDLTKTETEMWRDLTENAKRLIKKNENLRVERVKREEFLKTWKKWSKVWILSERDIANLEAVWKKDCQFWVIKDSEGWHSGILSLTTKDTFNYYQTFTTDLGRRSGGHFKLVWETMLWARKKGLRNYDFEGIYDPKYPIRKWQGFSEFKKKFGGKVVTHPGSWVKWF